MDATIVSAHRKISACVQIMELHPVIVILILHVTCNTSVQMIRVHSTSRIHLPIASCVWIRGIVQFLFSGHIKGIITLAACMVKCDCLTAGATAP